MKHKFNKVIAKVVGSTFHPLPEGKRIRVYGEVFEIENNPAILTRAILMPEPDNKHDKDAIKVVLELTNGEPFHIGYIGKEDPLKTQITEPRPCLVRVVDYTDSGHNISYQIVHLQ